MKLDLKKEIVLPEKVSAEFKGSVLVVKGPKGEVQRDFLHPKVKIVADKGKIMISSSKATKKEKMALSTFTAHIKGMVKGVVEPFQYKLKICASHFPMNVSVSGADFVVKNFLGETVPRKIKIVKGVEVKVNGSDIVVSCADKEAAGQMASRIENLCRITKRDIRVFQDGCYITSKDGKGVI